MLKFYDSYKKAIRGMNRVIDVATVILMLSMVGVVLYQVVMRQIFNNPPIWGEEVAISLMIWFVFLGIVLGLEEDLHIGITIFVSKLPKKAQFWLDIAVNALNMLLAFLFIRYGYVLASRMLGFGTRLPATGMPTAVHFVIVPVAGALMALVTVGKILGMFAEKRGAPDSPPEPAAGNEPEKPEAPAEERSGPND